MGFVSWGLNNHGSKPANTEDERYAFFICGWLNLQMQNPQVERENCTLP